MSIQELLPIGGYVLAGGKSSRMGTDKALVHLNGNPLIDHATDKLRGFCADVAILAANEQLACFGRLVPDLHPGAGPLAGVEAALADSSFDWNLIVPVDLPLVPTELLQRWTTTVMRSTEIAISYFEVGGRAQPALLLIHRRLQPRISVALDKGEHKMLPTLTSAGRGTLYIERLGTEHEAWFANVNTPEDLKSAEKLGRYAWSGQI